MAHPKNNSEYKSQLDTHRKELKQARNNRYYATHKQNILDKIALKTQETTYLKSFLKIMLD